MTKEETRRLLDALAETERQIAKELSRPEGLRTPGHLASLNRHKARLNDMLAGRMPA